MMILAVTVAITWMEIKIAVNMKIKHTHTHKKKQAAAADASLKKQYKANKINNKINWKNFYIKDCKYI